MKDIIAQNMVEELKVYCPNRVRFCPWIGEVQEVKGHLEGNCRFKEAPLWLRGHLVLLEDYTKENKAMRNRMSLENGREDGNCQRIVLSQESHAENEKKKTRRGRENGQNSQSGRELGNKGEIRWEKSERIGLESIGGGFQLQTEMNEEEQRVSNKKGVEKQGFNEENDIQSRFESGETSNSMNERNGPLVANEGMESEDANDSMIEDQKKNNLELGMGSLGQNQLHQGFENSEKNSNEVPQEEQNEEPHDNLNEIQAENENELSFCRESACSSDSEWSGNLERITLAPNRPSASLDEPPQRDPNSIEEENPENRLPLTCPKSQIEPRDLIEIEEEREKGGDLIEVIDDEGIKSSSRKSRNSMAVLASSNPCKKNQRGNGKGCVFLQKRQKSLVQNQLKKGGLINSSFSHSGGRRKMTESSLGIFALKRKKPNDSRSVACNSKNNMVFLPN